MRAYILGNPNYKYILDKYLDIWLFTDLGIRSSYIGTLQAIEFRLPVNSLSLSLICIFHLCIVITNQHAVECTYQQEMNSWVYWSSRMALNHASLHIQCDLATKQIGTQYLTHSLDHLHAWLMIQSQCSNILSFHWKRLNQTHLWLQFESLFFQSILERTLIIHLKFRSDKNLKLTL